MADRVESQVLTARPGWRSWMREIPVDWWQSSASASGQNHHGETQIEHSEEVFALAAWHWRRVPEAKIRKSARLLRSYLRAARFHDVGKSMDRKSHEIAGYNWMLRRDELAAWLILQHSGRWSPREVQDILDCRQWDKFRSHRIFRWMAETLQGCDYTAAHGWQRI